MPSLIDDAAEPTTASAKDDDNNDTAAPSVTVASGGVLTSQTKTKQQQKSKRKITPPEMSKDKAKSNKNKKVKTGHQLTLGAFFTSKTSQQQTPLVSGRSSTAAGKQPKTSTTAVRKNEEDDDEEEIDDLNNLSEDDTESYQQRKSAVKDIVIGRRLCINLASSSSKTDDSDSSKKKKNPMMMPSCDDKQPTTVQQKLLDKFDDDGTDAASSGCHRHHHHQDDEEKKTKTNSIDEVVSDITKTSTTTTPLQQDQDSSKNETNMVDKADMKVLETKAASNEQVSNNNNNKTSSHKSPSSSLENHTSPAKDSALQGTISPGKEGKDVDDDDAGAKSSPMPSESIAKSHQMPNKDHDTAASMQEDSSPAATGKLTSPSDKKDATTQLPFATKKFANTAAQASDASLTPAQDDSKEIQLTTNAASTDKSNDAKQGTETHESTKDDTSEGLSDESKALLKKHATMRENYCRRANELLDRCRQGLAEETFSISVPDELDIPDDAASNAAEWKNSFPDFAVKTLAALVESSSLSLSSLASSATNSLNGIYETQGFTQEATATKLKLLATRKNYVKNPWIASGRVDDSKASTDLFEDDNPDHMWRWEVALLDLLPAESVSKVKKARSARKKLSSHFSSLDKLLVSLNDADDKIKSNATPTAKLDKLLAKISQEEEKVLKFEREEEKARLAAEQKLKNEADKAERRKKKELAQEEKALLAEQKRQEKERKKQEAAQAKQKKKEEAARAKEEKEEKKKKEQTQKEAELKKQSACLMSFFSSRPANKKNAKEKGKVRDMQSNNGEKPDSVDTTTPTLVDGLDSNAFRSSIGSGKTCEASKLFGSLSGRAKTSRKRRTKRVPVSVFVTVYPDDPFAAQPYAEQRDVEVLNKFKFLLFHEDVRPPYHGTWSKRSSVVTGRTPFRKDASHLDYDNDSEAEWEEGDDEVGEDVENDIGDDEDEKDEEDGDENEDGWLAADDELEDELDEETKMLRRKQREADGGSNGKKKELTVCIVSPVDGVPLVEKTSREMKPEYKSRVDGFTFEQGCKLLETHAIVQVNDSDIYLDAFPPTLLDENEQNAKQDAMKIIANFIHHSTLKSKDRVVDELRKKHESITSSRAEAMRVLESIAEKKKHPVSGVYWEVKKDAREELGLQDLPTSPPPVADKPAAVAQTPVEESKSSKLSPVAAAPVAYDGSKQQGSSSKKRKAPDDNVDSASKGSSASKKRNMGSAKLLAAFLKNKQS